MAVTKTKHYSYKIGSLPKGCQMCVKGEKTVLFLTGKCSLRCFYCPISEQKANKDVVYFNERPSKNIRHLFEEIMLCSSKGVGITGGDPLIKLERAATYIKALKKRFGKGFHIHLYTPLNLVTEDALKKLYDAGLDEIRFHPDIYHNKLWQRLELARKFDWDIGVEVPIIPDIKDKYLKLIDFIKSKIDFLNMNELEVSDTNVNKIVEKGFTTKDYLSYGVLGSDQLAKELLHYIDKKGYRINVHYCTAKLKDAVQLRKRITKRARNVKKIYDKIDDGILVRGAIYGKDLIKLRKELMNEFIISPELIEYDKKKKRLLSSVKIVSRLKDILKMNGYKPVIVKDYPTYDGLNVETEYL